MSSEDHIYPDPKYYLIGINIDASLNEENLKKSILIEENPKFMRKTLEPILE